MGWIIGRGNSFIFRQGGGKQGQTYWLTRYISGLSVLTTGSTTQTITATVVGVGQDGVSFEYSTDNGTTWTVKGTAADGILNVTGLTANTYYKWRARLYRGTSYGSYYSITPTGTTYAAEAQALIARKIAAGETVTTREKDALNKAISALVLNGLFTTKFDVLVVPRTLTGTSHLFNWIKDANNGISQNNTLFVQNSGNKKDQATAYIDTNYNLATQAELYTQNDSSFIFKGNQALTGHIGCLDATPNGIQYNSSFARINGAASFDPPGNGAGWMALNRTSATECNVIVGVAKTDITSNNSSALPSLNPYIHRINYSSALEGAVTDANQFYAFGKSLSVAEFSTLQVIINQYYEDIDNIVNGSDYYLDTKSLFIPDKGVANILSQNKNWVLVYYGSEDVLYLSKNEGLTWDYTAAFTGCDNIRMACVFSSGAVLIGKRDNTLWSSQDFLSTISEVTVKNMDGSDFAFHVPVNASYPGEYFNAFGVDTYMVGDKEVLLWGLYDCYNVEAERAGSSPANMYYTADDGVTVKCCYKWGTGQYQWDNGTWNSTNGVGNALGDPANSEFIDHTHVVTQNPVSKKFIVITGEGNQTAHFAIFEYDPVADTWTVTPNKCPNEVGFRSCGMRFNPEGTEAIWVSDSNGNIYKADADNLIDSLVNQTLLYDGAVDFLGMSEYGEIMFAVGFFKIRHLVVSLDFGLNWAIIPDGYKIKLTAGLNNTATEFQHHKIMNQSNNSGYYIITRNLVPGIFSPKSSFLMKIIKL